MVGGGMAGVLTVQDMYHLGWEFGVGSGLDDTLRSQIWANKEKYIGRIIKYKYLPYGTVDAPRHPVFLGFRDKDDL
jgi:DNA ligase-1